MFNLGLHPQTVSTSGLDTLPVSNPGLYAQAVINPGVGHSGMPFQCCSDVCISDRLKLIKTKSWGHP